MKQLIAVLALTSFVLVCPLVSLAGVQSADGEMQSASEIYGLEIPEDDHTDGINQDQQDNNGDPHDLGGGFRGTGNPPAGAIIGPVPVGPIVFLLMQLI